MKNKFSILFLLLGISSFSQVGIGTTMPHSSAILELSSTDKALLLPRVASTSAVVTPTNGMLIYDVSSGCIKSYENGAWSSCLSSTSTPAASVIVDCAVNGFVGYYATSFAMTTANKFSVTVTNNSFSIATITFQPSDVVLSGVSGISVTAVSHSSVTLNPGQSQLVEYALSGVPSTNGTLMGTWTKLALNCTKSVVVVQPAITSLNCAGAINSGTLIYDEAASNVTSSISYTDGDGSAYPGQTIASTGVTGLTATLVGGNFATGTGTLLFTITGTPSAGGIAKFAISISGKTCELLREVSFSIPSSLTLVQNRTYFIQSVFDQDYLPYTAPTGAASTNAQAADGVNDAISINNQGSFTTTGVTVQLPVTATASGTLPAYTQLITIPANLTEDGVSRDITLSWGTQAYTTATKSIDATIAAVGETLNVKKLDLNAGVGNDALGVLLGQITYPYNSALSTTTFSIRATPGILDKMFGQQDLNNSTTSHRMLYLPVLGEDGKVWLNNNLGAHYTNMNHASFNPAQQATSATDHLAYGNLFQWGRKPDGHELITRTGSSTATAVNATTASNSNTPVTALFITETVTPYDWRVNQDNTLWATEASVNNPCPIGFRVPSDTEITALFSAATISNITTAHSSNLKFTLAGSRSYSSGVLSSVGTYGDYWTNTISSIYSRKVQLQNTIVGYANDPRSYGNSIRCIKD